MEHYIIPVTPYQQNCSILVCPESKKAAIVDPGGDLNVIVDKLKELEVMPEKILITHGHLDHAAGTHELSELLRIPVIGPHKGDQFWIDGLPQQAAMMGFPKCQSFTPTQWLEDGQIVTVGQEQLNVVHCPGHTPGHVVFVNQKRELAIVGDVLFQGSIGRTDFPGSDYNALISSIKEKLLPLGDNIRFVPGHGPMSSFGDEKRSNPFLQG